MPICIGNDHNPKGSHCYIKPLLSRDQNGRRTAPVSVRKLCVINTRKLRSRNLFGRLALTAFENRALSWPLSDSHPPFLGQHAFKWAYLLKCSGWQFKWGKIMPSSQKRYYSCVAVSPEVLKRFIIGLK